MGHEIRPRHLEQAGDQVVNVVLGIFDRLGGFFERHPGLAVIAALLVILTSCAPLKAAAPLPAGNQAENPDVGAATRQPSPTVTKTPTATRTPEPTRTPTVTPNVPEGWKNPIVKKDELGHLIATNEDGKQKIFIGNEWYPYEEDCYSDAFLGEETQGDQAKVESWGDTLSGLKEKIKNDPNNIYGCGYYVDFTVDYSRGPRANEDDYGGYLTDLTICDVKEKDDDGKIIGVIRYLMANILWTEDGELPVRRLGFGWFDRFGKFHTFTYYQETDKVTGIHGSIPDLTHLTKSEKAQNITSAWKMWNSIIKEKHLLEFRIPTGVYKDKSGTADKDYDGVVKYMLEKKKMLIDETISESIFDPEYVAWSLDPRSSQKFLSTRGIQKLYVKGGPPNRAYYNGVNKGKVPVMFVRTVTRVNIMK